MSEKAAVKEVSQSNTHFLPVHKLGGKWVVGHLCETEKDAEAVLKSITTDKLDKCRVVEIELPNV